MVISEEYARVYARIDLDAVLSNMENMRKNLPDTVKMMAVVKTDGYGLGAVPVAKVLEDKDYVFGFATATAEEAFELRDAGIEKPVLVLGYTFPYAYDRMLEEDIRPSVFRYDMLEELSLRAGRSEKKGGKSKFKIHIATDTGMSRIGIFPDASGLAFVKKAFEYDNLEVEGIFTHFARADEADLTNAHTREGVFASFLQTIEKETGRRIPIYHCANSASIIDIPEAHMDMVRAGVTMYGMWPSEEVSRDRVEIRPVLSLHSHVVFVKTVPAGTPVSYGGTFVTDRPTRIATIPVGYGDGYPRGLSGKGFVLIRGCKARILGRVCMDQFMVDVTDICDVKEGDPVTLIGSDGDETITIEELGDLSGRFNYELACDLNRRVPRIYVKNDKII